MKEEIGDCEGFIEQELLEIVSRLLSPLGTWNWKEGTKSFREDSNEDLDCLLIERMRCIINNI